MKQLTIAALALFLSVGSVFAEPPKPPTPTHGDGPTETPEGEFVECSVFHPFTNIVMRGFYEGVAAADFSDPDSVDALAGVVRQMESDISLMTTDEQCDYLRELLIDTLSFYAESFHQLAEASRAESRMRQHWENIARGIEEPRPGSAE